METLYILLAIGGLLGIGVAVVLLVMIFPKKKESELYSSFTIFLHNYFQFKTLYLETVIKATFLILTCISIFVGLFALFSISVTGLVLFLLLTVLAPIALRVAYETGMMFILLVTNTMEMNKKMGGTAPKLEAFDPASYSSTTSFSASPSSKPEYHRSSASAPVSSSPYTPPRPTASSAGTSFTGGASDDERTVRLAHSDIPAAGAAPTEVHGMISTFKK